MLSEIRLTPRVEVALTFENQHKHAESRALRGYSAVVIGKLWTTDRFIRFLSVSSSRRSGKTGPRVSSLVSLTRLEADRATPGP